MEMKDPSDLADEYVLDFMNVSSGRGTIASAVIRIRAHGKTYTEAACGDGAVDAATKAIDRVAGYRIRIEDFHIDSLTQGREALGRVTIVAGTDLGAFTGIGTSTDIVDASALAYMDVVNKYSRMKRFRRKGTR
jgi:2-isopropylmalate synthase